jgi:EmrB/QacA subfamily drug resistance transporter
VTFALLAVATAAFSFLQAVVVPALSVIEHELGTDTSGGAWILSAYLLSASVATPIAGRLGDMFGRKKALVGSLGVLAMGAAVSALATSIGPMVAGRVIQGLGGAVFPLAYGIIRDEFPREKVAGGIALVSALLGIGAGIGTVLSGVIVDQLGYHWLFWLPFVGAVVAAVGAAVVIPETRDTAQGRIDVVGAVLLASWLVGLLLAVSQGNTWGWTSAKTGALLAVSLLVAVVWVAVEWRRADPLVDMRMMRLPAIWTTNLAAFLFGFGMFSLFIVLASYVQRPNADGVGFGASVTQAGLFLLPTTVMMLLASPVAAAAARTVGSRMPLLVGALLSAAACAVLAFAGDQPWEVYVASAAFGAGLGLAYASLPNLIVAAVPPQQTGVATGMNTIVRTIGGAIGSQIAAGILAASVTVAGLPTSGAFTAAFLTVGGGFVVAAAATLLIPHQQSAPVAAPAARVAEAAR